VRFLIFYLLCGLVAAGAHVLVEPASPVPTVGASGAISGVMGAYLVLYPRVRVNMLFIFIIFFKVIAIPAWLVLLWWFAIQILTGLPQLMPMRPDVSGGVAVWAHVGGFVAGVILIKLFARRDYIVSHEGHWRPRRLGWGSSDRDSWVRHTWTPCAECQASTSSRSPPWTFRARRSSPRSSGS